LGFGFRSERALLDHILAGFEWEVTLDCLFSAGVGSWTENDDWMGVEIPDQGSLRTGIDPLWRVFNPD
jgi:hypothetical protein